MTCIHQDNTILDQTSKRIGFRRIELVQEPLQGVDQYGKGTTFLFEVNGIRMFMGGGCFLDFEYAWSNC